MAGWDSQERGLLGINSAIQGAVQGFYDAQNQKYRQMEMEAKLKAQEKDKERQAFMDSVSLYKSGLRKTDDGGFEERPLNEREKMEYQAKLAMRDPYGLKRMQAQKLQKEMTQGKQLAPDKVLLVQEGQQIPTMLEDIKETISNNKGSFGPVVGRFSAMNPYDEKAQAIDSQVRASSQAFGRYMEGGVLRKEDEEKYRKMFPQLGDTPEVAQAKLQNVGRMLARKQNENIKALKAQGYDVAGFQELPVPEVPEAIAGGDGLLSKIGGFLAGGNAKKGLIQKAESMPPPKKLKKEDKQALDWAKKNKTDPRAQQILQMLGQ